MKRRQQNTESGYTLVELMVAVFVLSVVAISIMQLFTALVSSALLMKRKSVALTLATNQMEYLKSLPYNNLAVAGGSIVATSPLPATTTKTVNGVPYTVRTSINYIDDAFDGCGSYPNTTLRDRYCRNYPPPSNVTATDTNAADYKIVHVSVTDPTGKILSDVDTEIAARVAETASNTGALFVTVIDQDGNPVQGANVQVVNPTSSPTVNVNDNTDSSGVAIFYGMPPDTTNYDYNITATLSGYSTLSTIAPTGSLQPYYANQQIITQQSSSVTLQIMPMGQRSLLMEVTDTSGNPIPNARVYVKGGYKKYNSATNTAYYYDNMTPSDSRPIAGGDGLIAVDNLVPGPYIFCGDVGATSCTAGSTTYYLAAAIPYTGTNSFNPIAVPTYDPASPPATTFAYSGNNYLQKVRLMLTSASNAPRIRTLNPDEASTGSSNMSAFAFQINGTNLPCTASGSGCGTTVKVLQGANTYTASCKGSNAGTQVSCTVNLSTASQGATQLQVIANGQTITVPASLSLGGITIAP
jgi:prepilin-type N-terminal cleavage/methylation domain-containing protein